MKRKRNYQIFINDIYDCIIKIEEFIGNLEYKQFIKDDKTISAVIRKLEVIGEAVKNIPEKVKLDYPELPWREMAGLRDKLIHDYWGTDDQILWNVIKEDIPLLKPLIKKVHADLQKKNHKHKK